MGLSALNQAGIDDAKKMLMQCCTSSQWIEHMINSRPFACTADVIDKADAHWDDLTEDDYLEAFDGHPKIGDIDSLKAKYADTKKLAAGEQSGMEIADDKIIEVLAKGNLDYEQKFGFIFIVRASGKTADEMSQLLLDRLPNDRQTEIRIAAEEQRKIFHIRLTKLLDKSIMSQITTHILDTALGAPAQDVPVALHVKEGGSWREIGAGVTNADGRQAGLCPSDTALPAGTYRMHFETASYFEAIGTDVFYPVADVVFNITGNGQHYHIPLLLSPYGYSTYRGS